MLSPQIYVFFNMAIYYCSHKESNLKDWCEMELRENLLRPDMNPYMSILQRSICIYYFTNWRNEQGESTLLLWQKKALSCGYVHACYACVYSLVFTPPEKRVWDGAGVCSSNRQVSGGTAAAKVKAKVAAASRPHTLRIQVLSDGNMICCENSSWSRFRSLCIFSDRVKNGRVYGTFSQCYENI